LQSFDELNHIFTHAGDIVCFQAPPEKISGKGLGHFKDGNDAFISARLETAPFTNISFRPEEIHGASGIGHVLKPFSKWDTGIGDETFRFSAQHHSIPHFHPNRRATIKTWRIDPDGFSRKKPADRQRFEPSLSEPFLKAINGDTIMSRKIVERRKRSDVIGVWIKPPRKHGKRKKLMYCLSPLFNRDG
jgi:hypothetical protein